MNQSIKIPFEKSAMFNDFTKNQPTLNPINPEKLNWGEIETSNTKVIILKKAKLYLISKKDINCAWSEKCSFNC